MYQGTEIACFMLLLTVLVLDSNSVNKEEVRNAAAKWLEDNQLINGDVHLPDFLYGMGWDKII